MSKQKSYITAILAAIWSAPFSWSEAEEPIEYNRDVRQILADNCFACHGVDSASRKADLRLDQRDIAVEFGAIVPGSIDESTLIERIETDDPELQMPPVETKKNLTSAQKELLKKWIAAGAEYQAHWSLIAPRKEPLPAVQDEGALTNAIDRFVQAKLDAVGLKQNAEADPNTLFRRLHLDITGLPPKPSEVDEFVKDYSQRQDEALSQWIDRLMESPAWGEHRARYWLDAARYADTHGLHFDNYREMWPYRDWVIRAFNANQPFDQFTIEQIAGDLLPSPTDDQLIATGFQRCNITTNEGGTIDEENLANYAMDRVQTFGWVYLGLTTNCAQCHDHKFDSLTMKDYYSLAAFFRNTTQGPKDGNVKDGRGPFMVVPSQQDQPRWEVLPNEIAEAKAKAKSRKEDARAEFDTWLASATPDSLDQDLPLDKLLVHLPLNEGAGNDAHNAIDATCTFRSIGDIAWVEDGKLGAAPVMKSGQTFELGDLGDFERDQSFSYGAWIRAGRDDVSGGIIARMDEQAAYRGWDLWQQGRSLAVHIIDAWPENGLKVATKEAVLKPGEWQHVFATYDGSGKPEGIKIFVDGSEVAVKVENKTLRTDASIRTNTPLRIGQRSHSQVFESGGIQDVRIYGRALSPAEVKSLNDVVPLRQMLATAADERTSQQQTALYEHYLAAHDTEYSTLSKAVATLESEFEAIKSRSPITHIQQEKMNSPAMAYILTRGEYDRPTDKVEAATPEVLHPMPVGAPQNRLGLAQWLVDPHNPLTARVTVNRFWQEVFGRGIVATPEDFGIMGSPPSHQELLDWLAVDFQEHGWDVKRLFKLMLMSATYRQSAIATDEKLEKDRDNRLLSRGPRFRLDAEMVRDYALAVSGLLSPKMYGPSVKPYQPDGLWDIVGLPGGDTRNYVQDTGENLYRRSVYSFWKRMSPPPNLEAFNAPSREVCAVQRERTNTPLQALVTLNDPQFVEAARRLAENALKAEDDAKVIEFIAKHTLCRFMKPNEQHILLEDLSEFKAYYESHPEDALALINFGDSKPDESIDVVQLAAWTMICNQVLNLDEVLNK